MKIGKKKTEVIAELFERFKTREGFGVTGHKLDKIAQALSESLANTKIHINVPYHSFNCHGTANKVAKDVIGLMPFSKNPININNTITFIIFFLLFLLFISLVFSLFSLFLSFSLSFF